MSEFDRAEFRIALTELHAVHAAAAAAAQSSSARWRYELIAARRKLQVQIGRLSDLLNAAGSGDDMQAVRNALNRMRSEVALHQANWPAVRIDVRDQEYRASLHDLLQANGEFTSLAEKLLITPSGAAKYK